MKNALFILGVGTVLASSIVLGGCGKPAAPPRVIEAKPTPTPTLAPVASLFDEKEFDADKLRSRADKAMDSVGRYLDEQDPKLRAKFQRMSNKFVDRITQDKDHWREKLKSRRLELEPQIAKLKERLAKEGGKAGEQVREQLSDLQSQNESTDQKISKLEAIGADAWKQFRKHLREEEKREKSPPVDAVGGDEDEDAASSPES